MGHTDIVTVAFAREANQPAPAHLPGGGLKQPGPPATRSGSALDDAFRELSAAGDRAAGARMRKYQHVLSVLIRADGRRRQKPPRQAVRGVAGDAA